MKFTIHKSVNFIDKKYSNVVDKVVNKCYNVDISTKGRDNMITEFGKILRIIRINSGDSAKAMAEKLNMSPSYLSTIENGKRNIPPEMEDLLIRAYRLSDVDIAKLRRAMLSSSDTVKLNLTELADKKKQVIFALTKEDIDEETVDHLCEIINNNKKWEEQ